MFALFEKLFDLLVDTWRHIIPWAVLGDDQVGLIRRLGKFNRPMTPGFNWKLPVIESAMQEHCAFDSILLKDQSLMTSDGVQVTVRGVITFRVVDARRYILQTFNPVQTMASIGQCVIAELIPDLPSSEVLSGRAFLQSLRRRIRARTRRCGVEVISFGLADRTRTRSIRLMQGG